MIPVPRHTGICEDLAATREASLAAAATKAAARELADSGMTLRDVGKVLGVSHKRVHQLLTG